MINLLLELKSFQRENVALKTKLTKLQKDKIKGKS